jgi:hypothetical protein
MKPGDIVLVSYLQHDGSHKRRPALVLEASETLTGDEWLWVAYGTSQRAHQEEHLPGELLIAEHHGASVFRASGLTKSTRFVLSVHNHVEAALATPIGCVHPSLMRAFLKAAKEAGLV